MDKQWTNAVCGQRKKPVNCVFTDFALVEVTGLEPTAPTSRKAMNGCSDLMLSAEMRRVVRFRANAFKVFCSGLMQFAAGVVSWQCPEKVMSYAFPFFGI